MRVRQQEGEKAGNESIHSLFYGHPEMIAYKNYCNRREVQHTQEAEETHCCPSRIPIIGPILFSLFIFSPFFMPGSDKEENHNPVLEERRQINGSTWQEQNEHQEDRHDLSPRNKENLGR